MKIKESSTSPPAQALPPAAVAYQSPPPVVEAYNPPAPPAPYLYPTPIYNYNNPIVSHPIQPNMARPSFYGSYIQPSLPYYSNPIQNQNPIPQDNKPYYEFDQSLYAPVTSNSPAYVPSNRRSVVDEPSPSQSASQSPRQYFSPPTGSLHSYSSASPESTELVNSGGTKRGFEEAASEFISNLSNKRFQKGPEVDESYLRNQRDGNIAREEYNESE